MKTAKRTLALLLTACLLCSTLFTSAFAAEGNDESVTPASGSGVVGADGTGDTGNAGDDEKSDADALSEENSETEDEDGIALQSAEEVLRAAVNAGGTVTLEEDVTLTQILIVTTDVTLNLNGHTIKNEVDIWNDSGNENNAWSLISVRKGGSLTINGEGALQAKENDCYAIDLQDEGVKCVINGGTFVGNISAVYVHDGDLIINGGEFSIQQAQPGDDGYRFTLNCLDESYRDGSATITVNGGSFSNFNPASNAAEGAGTSFVSVDYAVTEENGKYVVNKIEGKLVADSTMNGTLVSATVGGAYAGAQEEADEELAVADGSVTVNVETVDKKTNTAEVTISSSAATSMKDVALTVESDPATVTLDNTAMANVAKAAEEDSVKLIVKKNDTGKPTEATVMYSVTLKVNGQDVLPEETAETNGEITVTVAKPSGDTFYVYYVKNNVPVTLVEHKVVDGKIQFVTNHLSNYAIYTAEQATAVAECDDNYYPTLADAIAAANNGAIVTLLESTAEDITIGSGKSVTLNLNGKTLTNKNDHTILNKGTLTVVDSSSDKSGKVDNVTHKKAALYNDVGATATLNGGEFTRSKENGIDSSDDGGNSYYAVLNHGTMEVNSGVKVTQNGKYSSLFENGWYNGNQNTTKTPSKLQINGGTFSGGLNTIKNDDYGELTINDGTFTNTSQAAFLNWNVATVNGGNFESDDVAILNGKIDDTMDKGQLTINGGKFVSQNSVIEQMDYRYTIGDIDVNGGTFISKTKKDIVKINTAKNEDHVVIHDGDFSNSVDSKYLDSELNAELKKSTGEAPISYHKSVEDALKNAESGDTVTNLNPEDGEDSKPIEVYTVTVTNDGETVGSAKVLSGDPYPLPSAPTKSGYKFQGWKAGSKTYSAGDKVTITADTTFTAQWKKKSSSSGSSSSSSSKTEIDLDTGKNGDVSVSPKKPGKGDKVTITVEPDDGYILDTIKVTDEDGDKIKLTEKGENKYTFTMPSGEVTIETTFTKADGEDAPKFSFIDVSTGDWFAPAVDYVSAKGMMNGSNGYFSPYDSLTRGMIAQILYNLEGGTGSFAIAYPDVSPSDWYANAVSWVSANGIMSGYGSGLFGANDSVTREQLALTLYSYAKVKGYDTSASVELTAFADGVSTSEWAKPAMQWAVANGLFSGKTGNRLDPQGTATRAEVASILMRFCETIAK